MGTSMIGASSTFRLSDKVEHALASGRPIVALESALVTHGLPPPRNAETALLMEETVAQEGAVPATVGVLDGQVRIGLTAAEIERLARADSVVKLGMRDLAAAALHRLSGGTTVSATMLAAHRAGIRVFATGGIGGVHRENPRDVSSDLMALATIRIIVVCAGAKAILDLPATLEHLETTCVPVAAYQSSDFPAFYSRSSGLATNLRLDSPDEVASYWLAHCALQLNAALLLTNPIPGAAEIKQAEMEILISRASSEAVDQGVRGPMLTPFLLNRLAELSQGRTLDANVALLLNNARVAAQVATVLADRTKGNPS